MKILHLPFGYYPDIRGGTEVYVAALCRGLQRLGHECVVAAPGEVQQSYRHEGVEVHRYTVDANALDTDQNGEGDPSAAEQVGWILEQEQPDIVHLHALTSGVSLRVLREARRREIKTVLTYHTPTVSCVRGTLLYMGDSICDGRMNPTRCTACSLQGLGMPTLAAWGLAVAPLGVGAMARRMLDSGRLLTALRRKQMVMLRQKAVRAVFSEVDHAIVLCDWSRDLLRRNELAVDKTTLIPHALPHDTTDDLPAPVPVPESFDDKQPLKLLYLGRIAPEKGLHVLIQALAELPDQAPVQLDIYGLLQEDGEYARAIRASIPRDARIRLLPPVEPGEVTALIRQYHLLAVPSQWLETGPFVVLESLAAGTPVLGSKLGGIVERVRDGRDGVLVDPPAHVDSWCRAITWLLEKSMRIAVLRTGVIAPAGFDEVAKAHLECYRRVIEKRIS